LPQQLESAQWFLVDIRAQHDDIDPVLLYGFNQLTGSNGWGDHFKPVIASQCLREQLGVNTGVINHYYSNYFSPRALKRLH
jgi:hypothetical protein